MVVLKISLVLLLQSAVLVTAQDMADIDVPSLTSVADTTTGIEWVSATNESAHRLEGRAVVGGYVPGEGGPLWVIRAWHSQELSPGKLHVKDGSAYVPYDGKEVPVHNIEVLCAPAHMLRWVANKDGSVPPNAIPGGNTSSGETLYIGRAIHERSLIPGKIHPSHHVLYISFGGQEKIIKDYEVLLAAIDLPTITSPAVADFDLPALTYIADNSSGIEWVSASDKSASHLEGRAVVGGYEPGEGGPLWVIRAWHRLELSPGKLHVKDGSAYVPNDGKEVPVRNIEVLCAPANSLRWVASSNGSVPPNAIPGGNTSSGETLYIGRAIHERSLTPGKIQPSHYALAISFGGQEIAFKDYEVLCRA